MIDFLLNLIIRAFFAIVIALIFWGGIYWGYEFEKWNCNRVGMDFDYFVNGCVVRKNVKND